MSLFDEKDNSIDFKNLSKKIITINRNISKLESGLNFYSPHMIDSICQYTGIYQEIKKYKLMILNSYQFKRKTANIISSYYLKNFKFSSFQKTYFKNTLFYSYCHNLTFKGVEFMKDESFYFTNNDNEEIYISIFPDVTFEEWIKEGLEEWNEIRMGDLDLENDSEIEEVINDLFIHSIKNKFKKIIDKDVLFYTLKRIIQDENLDWMDTLEKILYWCDYDEYLERLKKKYLNIYGDFTNLLGCYDYEEENEDYYVVYNE